MTAVLFVAREAFVGKEGGSSESHYWRSAGGTAVPFAAEQAFVGTQKGTAPLEVGRRDSRRRRYILYGYQVRVCVHNLNYAQNQTKSETKRN